MVSQDFAVEGGLGKIVATNGHGAPVGFKAVPNAFPSMGLVFELQAEDPVGDHSNRSATANVDFPLEGVTPEGFVFVLGEIVGGEEADSRVVTAGKFNRDHHVGDHEAMFQEQAGYCILLFGPVDAM